MKIFLIHFWILLFGLHRAYGIPIPEFVMEEANPEFASPFTPILVMNTMENLISKLLFDNNNFSSIETSTMAGKVIDTTLDVPNVNAKSGLEIHPESTSDVISKLESTTLLNGSPSTDRLDSDLELTSEINSENTTSQINPNSITSAPVESSELEPESKLPMADINAIEESSSDSELTSQNTTTQNNPSSTMSAPIESSETEYKDSNTESSSEITTLQKNPDSTAPVETNLPLADVNAIEESSSDSELTSQITTTQNNPSSTMSAPIESSETEFKDSNTESSSEITTLQKNPNSIAPVETKLPLVDFNATDESSSKSESIFEITTPQNNPSSTMSAPIASSKTEFKNSNTESTSEITTLQKNPDSTASAPVEGRESSSESETISEIITSHNNPSSTMSAPIASSETDYIASNSESTSEITTLQKNPDITASAPVEGRESSSESETISEIITSHNNPSSTMSAPIASSETEHKVSNSESTSDFTTLQNNPSSTMSAPIHSSDTEPKVSDSESISDITTLQNNPSSTMFTSIENSETQPDTKLPLTEEHHESKTSETTEITMTSTESKHENTIHEEPLMGAEDNDLLSNESVELSTSTENTKIENPELLINFESKVDKIPETSTGNSVQQTQAVSSTTIDSEKETPSERYTVIYLTTTENTKSSEHDDKSHETKTEIHSTTDISETKPGKHNLVMATKTPTVPESPLDAINLSNYNEFTNNNRPQNVPLAVDESGLTAISEMPEDITSTTIGVPATTYISGDIEESSGDGDNTNNELESEMINKFVIDNLTVQSVPILINNSFTTAGPPVPDRHENGTINFDKLNKTIENETSETGTSTLKITTTTSVASTANSKTMPSTQSTTTFTLRPSTVPVSTITPHERVNKETNSSSSTIPLTTTNYKSIQPQSRSPKENAATQPQMVSIILIAFSFFYCRILM